MPHRYRGYGVSIAGSPQCLSHTHAKVQAGRRCRPPWQAWVWGPEGRQQVYSSIAGTKAYNGGGHGMSHRRSSTGMPAAGHGGPALYGWPGAPWAKNQRVNTTAPPTSRQSALFTSLPSAEDATPID